VDEHEYVHVHAHDYLHVHDDGRDYLHVDRRVDAMENGTMSKLEVLVIAGDGIGPEVTREAVRVLEAAARLGGVTLNLTHAPFGGASVDQHGVPATEEVLRRATEVDAVLLGAVGGPKYDALPAEKRPEKGLLALRSAMEVYANLRPAKIFPSLVDASPLRPDLARSVDYVVVRELIGGLYFGKPRSLSGEPGKQVGINTLTYTEEEIRRIGRTAFEIARQRNKRVCSVDKANVLETMVLWRKTMDALAKEYPDVSLSHMYVDNCSMQLVLNPAQFDVIVTENMFGDILSDEAGATTGSIGLLPSASLGDRCALYEPIHGSAPDIAGQDKANPLAAILSVAMLFEYTLKNKELAARIEGAVVKVLEQGYRTADLWRGDTAGKRLVGTREMGDAVLAQL
jgi:3-isopropylmalate dehydrogenase